MEFSEKAYEPEVSRWFKLGDIVEFLKQKEFDLDGTLISFYSNMHRKFVKTHSESLRDWVHEKDIEVIDKHPALRIRVEKCVDINSESSESENDEQKDEEKKQELEKAGKEQEESDESEEPEDEEQSPERRTLTG